MDRTWMLTCNDRDFAALGVTIERVTGLLDAPDVTYPTEHVPGCIGTVLLSDTPETGDRPIEAKGMLVADTPDELFARVGILKQWIRGRVLEIRSIHAPTVFYRGRYRSCRVREYDPQFGTHLPGGKAAADLTLRIVCDDPRGYGADDTVIAFAQTPTPVPQGTAAAEPVIRVMGPATNPMLTYRNAAGDVRGQHGVTWAVASGEFVEFHTPNRTILLYASGAITNLLPNETPGAAYDFITFDPADGDPSVEAWPTIEVSVGTAEALYPRTYW